MKFGKLYLSRIPTEFQRYSLDYEELKSLMKVDDRLTFDTLEESITQVDRFIQEQLALYPYICDTEYQKNFKLFICLTRQAISKFLYKIDDSATMKLREYIKSFKWFRSLSFNTNTMSLGDFFALNSIDSLNRTRYHFMAITNTKYPLTTSYNTLDLLNHSPVFYSILHNHFEVFTQFMDFEFAFSQDDWLPLIKHNRIEFVEYLICHPIFATLDLPDYLLHFCCIFNHYKLLSILLKYCDKNQLYKSTTPLIMAAKENSLECAQILLNEKANFSIKDMSNWTALEHATYRGFTDICQLFPKVSISPTDSPVDSPKSPKSPNSPRSPFDKKSSKIHKSYGHPYLKDLSSIQIIIGTVDCKDVDNPIHYFNPNEFDLALELEISIKDQKELVALPIQDKHTIDPLQFTCLDPLNEIVYFKVYSDVLIGMGALLVNSLLVNTHVVYNAPRITTQVPLFIRDTVVGYITVQLIIIKPFQHPLMAEHKVYWKELKSRMIGHRGNGSNKSKHANVAENTILSFVTAANLGAEYIEFDVQVTKDLVPVIYHDFIVKETNVTLPVNGLTLKEFQQLKQESNGYDSDDDSQRSTIANALVDKPLKGKRKLKQKSIAKSHLIQTPFTTLQEAFKTVPSHVGFNIEVKYPNHDEVMQDGIFCADINKFVDAILTTVYEHCQDRSLFFSSFHPEICTLLNQKQNSFPIFFLTDAGFMPYQDMRLNSLQAAVRFAKSLGLMGIVTFCEPLLMAPTLINKIKSSGLLLFSYGSRNNDGNLSRLQTNYGLDAVIVDSVTLVRKELSK